MAKAIYQLSDDETEILSLGRTDADYLTNYFFKKSWAEEGWKFDYNFDEEGQWQRATHHASQRRIVIIGGFGSGKTRGIGISACCWCMTTPDFTFMNAAPRSWQSEIMYKFILDIARDTPFEKLIYSNPKRPYPSIEIRFIVRGVTVVSTMEFMSIDKNASQILTWEGDWVNIEEGGKSDTLGEVIANLGSRMRGQVNGRERLGRMSIISNSWDNPELWYRYDLAKELPEDHLSMTISTRHNHNVTPSQLKLMLRDIPENEHEQLIDGGRPEGKGNYFNKKSIYACEDTEYSDFILGNIAQKKPGFGIEATTTTGVCYFTTPPNPRNIYMLFGDPGEGNAPNRNAPALLVWDVTDFPQNKANLAAAWWGFGRDSITPFVKQLIKFMRQYNPFFTGVDSTGPQKSSNELINTFIFGQQVNNEQIAAWIGEVDLTGILNPHITGMDFSGTKKSTYLTSAKLMLEGGYVVWPKFFIGLRSQLSNYDREKDRPGGKTKITQDLVAAFAMSSYGIHYHFQLEFMPEGDEEGIPLSEFFNSVYSRTARSTSSENSRYPRSNMDKVFEIKRESHAHPL